MQSNLKSWNDATMPMWCPTRKWSELTQTQQVPKIKKNLGWYLNRVAARHYDAAKPSFLDSGGGAVSHLRKTPAAIVWSMQHDCTYQKLGSAEHQKKQLSLGNLAPQAAWKCWSFHRGWWQLVVASIMCRILVILATINSSVAPKSSSSATELEAVEDGLLLETDDASS